MALNVAAIKAEVKEIQFGCMGDIVTLKYRPGEVTPEMQRRLMEEVSPQEATERYAQYFETIVAKWDILDKPKEEGGVMWPIKAESIRELPYTLLNAIASAINEDVTVDPTKPANS
jgi:hypothetical protein